MYAMLSTQNSNITQCYHFFPFTLHGCFQSPQNTLSTRIIIQPRYFFLVVVVVVAVHGHNRFQFHHWNLLQYIQYSHANDISLFWLFIPLPLFLSSSVSLSYASHSSFKLIVESESIFFKKGCSTMYRVAKDENRLYAYIFKRFQWCV